MHTKLLYGVGSLAVASLIAASAAADTVKFDFWYGLTGALSQHVQELCKKFNESQKDYEVICTSQGTYYNALQNTIAAYRGGKPPTVVQVFDVGTLDLMLSDAYYPAYQLMADNSYKIDWKNYFAGIRAYYATSKGDMLSFPFNSSTALLYWNKDAFQKIGKTEAPKTWEEAGADMKALKDAGYDCPLAIDISQDESWQLMEQFSAVHGEPISTKDNGFGGLDAELTFNKTKFVKFVTDLKGWYDQGLAKIKSPNTGEDYVAAFAAGHCQMTLTSVGDHGTVGTTAAPGMHWDVAMLPLYEGTARHNSFVGGASLWTIKGHTPEEYKGAATFLNFLSQPEQALFWSTVTGYIPVTKTGFDYMKAQGFYDKAPYKGREVAIQQLSYDPSGSGPGGIRLGSFLQIRGELSNSLQAIFANKETVQQGLDEAVQRGNMILRRFEATYKGKTLP
jgi:sn-glycerol 3-phosphate transport system substrate-binding protein